jgi:hypothetical protein
MYLRGILIAFAACLVLGAQEQTAPVDPPSAGNQAAAKEYSANADQFLIPPGTKVPLSMINSVSTKTASEGERIYLETVFPILANGHVVIPPGSYVAGTVTDVKRPGRLKGRGELYIRFDSLTLPNGVTRDFRARIGSLDGRAAETLDKAEGKIKSEGNKTGDVKVIGEAAGIGATAGGLAGAAAGHAGMGAGIGAAAGATAGLIGVLVSRGPEAILAKGTTMDMVLDRPLQFTSTDIDFSNPMARPHSGDGQGPLPSRKSQSYPQRRWPL